MKPILLPRLFFVFLFFVIAGCQKELTLDVVGNGNTTAVFSIANFESGCPAITVNGHYVKGVPLTAGESITVEVDVTKTGKWEFSSNKINGISFSGGGSFSNTGKQEIKLTGTGTPLSPGNYNFLPTGSASYDFLVRVVDQDGAEETVGASSYFKVTFGGRDYNMPAIIQGPDDIAYGFYTGDTASFGSYVAGGNYPNLPEPGTVSLQKNGMLNYHGSSDADFKNFFKPGAYPLTNFSPCIPFANGTTGFLMFLVDENDESWGTTNGSSNQEGSSIMIVGAEDGYNKTGNYFVKVKVRFNLKLYKYPTGEMRELTNGEMVSYFIKPL